MPTAPETTTRVTTVALAEAARRQQVQIRNAAIADIARLWRLLDFDRLDATWQAWLAPVTDILTRRHKMSADAAALFYRAARQHATGDPGSVDLAKLADPPLQEWTSRALGYAGPGTYARQIEAKVPPEQANRAALAQTLGTTSRIVLDGGRTTIDESVKADPVALGYYRVTDGDPCAFCALMASRGMVYKDAASAGADANKRFTGEGQFKFHNDCGCSVIPGFTRGIKPTGVAAEADRIYKEMNGTSLADFRREWNNRQGDGFSPRESSKPTKPRKPAAPKAAPSDIDARRTTAELKATLADLERSALKFSTPATKARIEELRRKIAAR